MSYKNKEDKAAHNKRYRTENPDVFRSWFDDRPNYYKEWRKKNPRQDNTAKERLQRYRELNRDKVRARDKLYYEIKKGRILRPDKCSECGKLGKIEADHHDYTKPLDVTWLCKDCHNKITKQRVRQAKGWD